MKKLSAFVVLGVFLFVFCGSALANPILKRICRPACKVISMRNHIEKNIDRLTD